MFSRFLGKGDKPVDPQVTDAVDSRGLEVVDDDPETVWGLWDDALAQQESRFGSLESVRPDPADREPVQATVPMPLNDPEAVTQPLALEEKSQAQRQADALQVVDLHHHRIANTIRSLWGYKECSAYINKLIMNGGDGMGQARIGFNQEAVVAMMALADLHEAQFGPAEMDSGFGFTSHSAFSGLDKFR
jgi:hypothetical protein